MVGIARQSNKKHLIKRTWGLVLSWNRVDWQLDTVPPARGEEAVGHYSLLPLDPPTPPRGAWSPALTWMGILPQALGPLQELLEPLRPALRLKVKLLLSQTIIAAQKRSWDMSFDMIQQFLIRQKRVTTAAARNIPPPRWYPILSPDSLSPLHDGQTCSAQAPPLTTSSRARVWAHGLRLPCRST